MEYKEDDYLMLSGIQHFAFCRRQWSLIHIEQQWEENYRTTAGELFHNRAHDNNMEKRGSIVIARGLRIASRRLGLSGQCDIVEFHSYSEGITINKYPGTWSIYPVEYKKGLPKEGCEDNVQLCAQAICLEEMFLTKIHEGSLYYGENKRRTKVQFTDELRNRVYKMAEEMHQMFIKGHTPKVKTTKKCNACSLKNLCLPKLLKNTDVKKYIEENINVGDE